MEGALSSHITDTGVCDIIFFFFVAVWGGGFFLFCFKLSMEYIVPGHY